MCEQLGLVADEVVYDATSFQFWGSEIVKNNLGIHTAGKKTIFLARLKAFFKGYEKLTKKLNKEHKGDQAIFFISKKLCAKLSKLISANVLRKSSVIQAP